jgi:hypothetical protein
MLLTATRSEHRIRWHCGGFAYGSGQSEKPACLFRGDLQQFGDLIVALSPLAQGCRDTRLGDAVTVDFGCGFGFDLGDPLTELFEVAVALAFASSDCLPGVDVAFHRRDDDLLLQSGSVATGFDPFMRPTNTVQYFGGTSGSR